MTKKKGGGMKKIFFILAIFLISCLGISFAQEDNQKRGAMEHEGKMTGKKNMHCMMMKKMMQKEMVATKDGGVIVLAGNKLMKYDKDLNLVKEVEIKMDMEAMANKMKECMETMKKCGMDMSETSE